MQTAFGLFYIRKKNYPDSMCHSSRSSVLFEKRSSFSVFVSSDKKSHSLSIEQIAYWSVYEVIPIKYFHE